jgi:hypothetical protein
MHKFFEQGAFVNDCLVDCGSERTRNHNLILVVALESLVLTRRLGVVILFVLSDNRVF